MRSTITQVDLVQEFKLASAFGQKSESGGGKGCSDNFSKKRETTKWVPLVILNYYRFEIIFYHKKNI